MNLVGIKGQGESIWLGFFLFTVLRQFADLARQQGDHDFAARCITESTVLQQNIEANGWDGEWYRRAYFDDGTPLGSSNNKECRIDSIAQSWSVLSGAAEPLRAKQALASLHHYLVRPKDGLVTLLDPPFDVSKPNPGYIQDYVPGIRENGGQYTHAATWVGMAFAALGDSEHAWQVFNIINPIHHGGNYETITTYKIEPYVMSGDVYSVAPHIGHGGWSWYTGSAGWMYHLLLESLLGITLDAGNKLRLKPNLPANWNEYTVNYRYAKTLYEIKVTRQHDNQLIIMLDDAILAEHTIPLIDDGGVHRVVMNVL
jgi:cyclic beta-1,2-glucan synthetase